MLITAAPCSIARAMPATELAQRISFGRLTLSARMPGQTPRMPRSFLGAAATAAVSVPCALSTGKPPSVETLPPANSGWLTSAVASTSASSGLGRRDRRRDEAGVDDRGAPRGAGVERVGRRDLRPTWRAGRARRRGAGPWLQRRGELARAAAGDDVGAGADAARAVARRRRRRPRGPAWRRRSSPAPEAAAPASPGSTIGGRGRRGARGRSDRQEENRDEEDQAAHRATVGTQSAHGRSGVPVRTARSSAGAGR